jgi:hypothetical protein
MGKRKDLEERDRLWEQHLRDWKSSGLSQAEYCRRNKVNPKSFLYWKRREKAAGEPVCLVEVPVQRQVPAPIPPSVPVRLLVGNRYRIEIEKNFDVDLLDRLIVFLERR